MTSPYRELAEVKTYKIYDLICSSCELFGIATIYYHDSNPNQPLYRACIQQHNLFDENDYAIYGYHSIDKILAYPSSWRYWEPPIINIIEVSFRPLFYDENDYIYPPKRSWWFRTRKFINRIIN